MGHCVESIMNIANEYVSVIRRIWIYTQKIHFKIPLAKHVQIFFLLCQKFKSYKQEFMTMLAANAMIKNIEFA